MEVFDSLPQPNGVAGKGGVRSLPTDFYMGTNKTGIDDPGKVQKNAMKKCRKVQWKSAEKCNGKVIRRRWWRANGS
jgi:hypothetical protein